MPGLSSPVAAAQFIVAGQQGFRSSLGYSLHRLQTERWFFPIPNRGADVKTIVPKWHLAVLVLIATAGNAWGQQGAEPAVTSKLSTVQATVQAVYPDKRSLTLVGPNGQPQTIFVSPDVKLDRLHAGDKVNVSYYQGFAAQIVKGTSKVTDPAPATFTYKNADGTPGGGVGASVTESVKILGVDPGTNKVAFQQADGSQHVIAVKSPNMRKFIRTLKAGDNVDVTYTESVAVSVTPST
jgi:hypothetical protein